MSSACAATALAFSFWRISPIDLPAESATSMV
jgi:hypothetical protein